MNKGVYDLMKINMPQNSNVHSFRPKGLTIKAHWSHWHEGFPFIKGDLWFKIIPWLWESFNIVISYRSEGSAASNSVETTEEKYKQLQHKVTIVHWKSFTSAQKTPDLIWTQIQNYHLVCETPWQACYGVLSPAPVCSMNNPPTSKETQMIPNWFVAIFFCLWSSFVSLWSFSFWPVTVSVVLVVLWFKHWEK